MLFNTDNKDNKEIKALQLLKEQRIQGVLITPSYTEKETNYKYLKMIEKTGVPVVILDGFIKYNGFNGVFIDHEKGAYNATKALIEAGHRKIAIINGDMKTRPAKERYNGYKKALKDYDITFIKEYDFYAHYDWIKAYEATKSIIFMKARPTAIFVTSNMMILGCLKALNELKLSTPKDIAIVGFDNVDVLNNIGMNISYVYGPSFQMGIRGMKILSHILGFSNNSIINDILNPGLMLKGSEKYSSLNE